MKKLTKSALILAAVLFAAAPLTLSAKCGGDGAKKEAPKTMKCGAGKCGASKSTAKKADKDSAKKADENSTKKTSTASKAMKCAAGKCGGK